jgi:hypothetical protein
MAVVGTYKLGKNISVYGELIPTQYMLEKKLYME